MNVLDFPRRKQDREPLVMVTCYDFSMARLVADSDVDLVLVGDSAAMVMHGHADTLPIALEELAGHVRAVRRGAPETFIVADLPFLSFRKGLRVAMDAVESLVKAGAQAVKIEGITGHADLVRHIVESGVPVMGHLGLTPQSLHQLGGFRVQGRDDQGRQRLREQARACQAAGCFALVLECVPDALAREITAALDIPTIGIGAGDGCDGQVLVLHDLLGLTDTLRPKFVRRYLDGRELIVEALNAFASDVKSGAFPARDERYSA